MADTNGTDHLVRHDKDRPNGFENDGYHPCDRPKSRTEDRLRVSVTNGSGHRLTNGHEPSNGSAVVVVDDDKAKSEVSRLRHYVPVTGVQQCANGDKAYVTIPEEDVHVFTSEKELLDNLSESKKHRHKESIPLKDMAPPVYVAEDTNNSNHKNGDSIWTTDDKNPFREDCLNEAKLAQGNGTAKSDDEFFMPANNHKKCLREGEKLYLTEDSRKLCQGKRRLIVCGLIVIIIAVALLVGVLAATGILLAESESKSTRYASSGPSSASVSHAGPPFRSQPPSQVPQDPPPTGAALPEGALDAVSRAPSQVSPKVPALKNDTSQTLVPNALVGEFTIIDENFTEDLGDNNSSGYKFLTQHLERELHRIFERNGAIFESLKILSFRPGSIKVKFFVLWKSSQGIILSNQASEIMQNHLKKTQNLLLGYTVDPKSIVFTDVFDECRIEKGGCSYLCEWSYLTLQKTCLCKDNEFLLPDNVSCTLQTFGPVFLSTAEYRNESTTYPIPVTESATTLNPDFKSGTETTTESMESITPLNIEVETTTTTSSPEELSTSKSFITTLTDMLTLIPGFHNVTEIELTTLSAPETTTNTPSPSTLNTYTEISSLKPTTNPTIIWSSNINATLESNENFTTTDSTRTDSSASNTTNGLLNGSSNSPILTDTTTSQEDFPTTLSSETVEKSYESTMTTPGSLPAVKNETEAVNASSTESSILNVNYNESTTNITTQSDESQKLTTTDVSTVPPSFEKTTESFLNSLSTLMSEIFQSANRTPGVRSFDELPSQSDNSTVSVILNMTDMNIETNQTQENSNESITTTVIPTALVTAISEVQVTTVSNATSSEPLEVSTNFLPPNTTSIVEFSTETGNYTDVEVSKNATDVTFNDTTDYIDYSTEVKSDVTPTSAYEVTTENASQASPITTSETILTTEPATTPIPKLINFTTPVTTSTSELLTDPVSGNVSVTDVTIVSSNDSSSEGDSLSDSSIQNNSTVMPENRTSSTFEIPVTIFANESKIEYTVTPSDVNSTLTTTFQNLTIGIENNTTANLENNVTESFTTDNATEIPVSTDHYFDITTFSTNQSITDNITIENQNIPGDETNATMTSIDANNGTSENSTEMPIFVEDLDTDQNSTVNVTSFETIMPSIDFTDQTMVLNTTDSILFNDTEDYNATTTTYNVTVLESDLNTNTDATDFYENGTTIGEMFSDANFTEMDQFNFNVSDVELNTLLPVAFNLTGINITLYNENGTFSMNEALEEFNETMNGTEPTGIECREDQFICEELNVCLNNTFLCDGIADCPDGEDETECRETCYTNFMCANFSTCIMSEARCDGIIDCDDGSDEQNCTPMECAKHEVMCTDGSKCIKPGHICDWKYNCRDRSDEVGCVERTTCEQLGRFFCNDGLCIPWSLKCDGDFDCKDGEDEGNCTCLNDEFRCTDGKCLKSSSRCDGHQDCPDAVDEMGCVTVDEQGTVSTYEPYSGTWSLLCAEDWSLDDGHYLCQELGFGHALSTERYRASFNGTWMGMRRENLTATSLWTERVSFVESCTSSLAAAVMCQKFDCGNYSGLLHRRKREESFSSSNSQWPFIGFASTFQSDKGCLSEILTPIWLVTSAECLLSVGKEPHNGSEWYVRTNVGQGFIGDSAQNHEVLKIISHPHSSKFRSLILRDYDLALIRLKHALVFSDKIGAICLPEEQVPSGITCFSGVLGTEKPRAPPPTAISINSLALMVLDRETCNMQDQYNNQVNQRMLCTKSSDSQSICDNDEGTPLMCLSEPNKWYLAGMLTYQRYCGIYNWHPAVFSNLFSMRKFIDKVTGQKQYELPYDSNLYIILPPTTPSPTEPETTSMMSTVASTDIATTTLFPLVGDKLHYDISGPFATVPGEFRSENGTEVSMFDEFTLAYDDNTTTTEIEFQNGTDATLSGHMEFDLFNASSERGLSNHSGDQTLRDDINKTHGFIVIRINESSIDMELDSTTPEGFEYFNETTAPNFLFELRNISNVKDLELTNVTIIWLNATDVNVTRLIGDAGSNRMETTESPSLYQVTPMPDISKSNETGITSTLSESDASISDEIKTMNDSLITLTVDDFNDTTPSFSNESLTITISPFMNASEALETLLEESNSSIANMTSSDNQTLSTTERYISITATPPTETDSNTTTFKIGFNSTNDVSNIVHYTIDGNSTDDSMISFEITASDPSADVAFTMFNIPEGLVMGTDAPITNITNEETNNPKLASLKSHEYDVSGQNGSLTLGNISLPRSLNTINGTYMTFHSKPLANSTAFKVMIDDKNVTTFVGDENDPDSFSKVILPVSDIEVMAKNFSNSSSETVAQPPFVMLLINESSIFSLNPNETMNSLGPEKLLLYKDELNESEPVACGMWARDDAVNGNSSTNGSNLFMEWPALGFLKFIPEPKICACAIISSRFVLAPYSCLARNDSNASDWAFIGGFFNNASSMIGSQYHVVQEIIPHPEAINESFSAERDFALVKMKERIKWSKYSSSVCLPRKDVKSEQNCFSPAWNKTLPDDDPGKAFHAIPVAITSPEKCNDTANYNETLPNAFICTIYNSTFDPCQVESGLPLFCPNDDKRWELHGLSRTPNSCDSNHFSAYNNIRSVQNWISETLTNHTS